MESKYYVPSIDELYVGFEYELNSKSGIQFGYSKHSFTGHIGPILLMDKNNVRVKYLDKEDIESLGFEIDESHISMMSDENPEQIDYMFCSKNHEPKYKLLYCNWWVGNHDDIDEHRLVRIQRRVLDTDDYNTIFSGCIKNKSELKQVLKILGYGNKHIL